MQMDDVRDVKGLSSRAALGARYLQRPGIRAVLWGCVAATAAVIFAFSSQVGSSSALVSQAVADFIIRLVEGNAVEAGEASAGVYSFVTQLVRKRAHFAEFALLGCCLRLLAGACGWRRPTRLCWLIGTVYAATDELHQLLVADRAGMWQDVLLDSAGVLAGITFAYAMLVILWRLTMRLGKHKEDRKASLGNNPRAQ